MAGGGIQKVLAGLDVEVRIQEARLTPDETMKIFGMLNIPGMLAGRGRNMAAGDFAPSFELVMARKDVRLMLETAVDHPTPVLSAIADRMDELILIHRVPGGARGGLTAPALS